MEDHIQEAQYSSSSSTCSAALAWAKAVATKACLSFAEKEMKIEKARLEASMDLLKQETETAAAVAIADAMEAAVDHHSMKE